MWFTFTFIIKLKVAQLIIKQVCIYTLLLNKSVYTSAIMMEEIVKKGGRRKESVATLRAVHGIELK